MIVRYVRERDYKGSEIDSHLTLGKEYIVLSISFFHSSSNALNAIYQICVKTDNDNYPCFFDFACFDIVDSRVPIGWSFTCAENGNYYLDPQEFDVAFWELFHDDDDEAKKIFEAVVKKIKSFHDLLPESSLLKLLKEMQRVPIKADLSKSFQFLNEYVQSLFNKIENSESLEIAASHFYLLQEIQFALARLSFQHNVPMPDIFKKFITDFSPIDYREWRELIFQRIQEGEYSLGKLTDAS